jgi:hypothetical protein
MTAQAGVISEAPKVKVSNARPQEKDLYKMLWDKPEYRDYSPGEQVSHIFLEQANPKAKATVLDRLWYRKRWFKSCSFWWIRCNFCRLCT